MKVFIGTLNIASQPKYLVDGLRRYGIDAHSATYGNSAFGYENDEIIPLPKLPEERARVYVDALLRHAEMGYDIYHFFQKPFCLSIPSKNFDGFLGWEIPLLRARGAGIAYRFTGWEVIKREIEVRNNPYSAFNHGWDGAFNQELKDEYLEFLRNYVDEFMVVDPMMQEHCPEANIVPRILPVDKFVEVGIGRKSRPLVLHAPSNSVYKGSKYILQSLERLKSQGLNFELKVLERVPFEEAIEWYKKADIIVDQALIGWYGVAAMECMAMGKPVAVYMRDDLVDTPRDVPIQNFNLDNIDEKLREIISSYELRSYLSSRARKYVEDVHSESVVIPKLIEVYKKIQERKATKVPSNLEDLRYMGEQCIAYHKTLHESRQDARRWERIAQAQTASLQALQAKKPAVRIPGRKGMVEHTSGWELLGTVRDRLLKKAYHVLNYFRVGRESG